MVLFLSPDGGLLRNCHRVNPLKRTIRENTKPAYSLWKLVAQYTPWQKKFMRLTLTGGIQNLFDYTDTEHYTTYDAGRRFFGSVIFRF